MFGNNYKVKRLQAELAECERVRDAWRTEAQRLLRKYEEAHREYEYYKNKRQQDMRGWLGL